MSTPNCNTCGLPGHQRTTHRDCLANPNRLAMRQRNENEEPHVNVTRTVPVCASCGQEGHLRSTHRSCPNYNSNNNSNNNNNITQENLRVIIFYSLIFQCHLFHMLVLIYIKI